MPRYFEEDAVKAMIYKCTMFGNTALIDKYEVLSRLRNIPTADVVPAKHGKWTRLEYDTFTCNLCGSTFMLMQGMSKMNYCPNCGAEMTGENDG